MRHLLLFGLMTLLLTSCAPEHKGIPLDVPGVERSEEGLTWQIVQSPLTSRCYEVFSWIRSEAAAAGGWGFGFAAMAEVPCEEPPLSSPTGKEQGE